MSAWLASLVTSIVAKLASHIASLVAFLEARRAREATERKALEDKIAAIDELLRRPPPASEEERKQREEELDELQKDLF